VRPWEWAAAELLKTVSGLAEGKFYPVMVSLELLLEFVGRGLHPSTFRLNVSAFCGTRGAFRCCLRFILCHKRLKLSWKVDVCKPLLVGAILPLGVVAVAHALAHHAAPAAAAKTQ
jgi:hypothetical protein